MKLNEIRAKAEAMQIKAGKMRKADLIRTIQLAEGNTPCFQQKECCAQTACCWQDGCATEMAT